MAEQQTWSVEDDAVVRAALDVLRRDVQERPLADAAFVRARGDARRRHRRVTVALASAAAAVAVGYVGVQALVEPAGRVVGPVGRPTIAVSAPTGAGGTGATTGAADPSVPLAVPGPLPVAQEYQRALGLRGRVVVSDLKESEGAVLDCPQVRSPGVRVAGQSVTSVGPGVYGDQAVYRATDPATATRAATTLEQQLLDCPMLTVSAVGGQGPPTGAPQQRAGQRAVVRHHPLRRPGRAAQRRPDPDQPDVALDDGAAAGPRRRGPAAAAARRGCAGDHAARPAVTSGAGAGASGPSRPQGNDDGPVTSGEVTGPSYRLEVLGQPRFFMISRIRSAVADGVLPTLTPAASRASCLAAAVPDEPDTIAPAWPIVLPSGAVKPAT